MDLPTYTSIWRIEKRLYKLYDFRLPMPLPIGQITVFAALAVPYVVLLTIAGLPFNHTLVWLYVLPPGAATWLVTRPVLEGKRLPELVKSQVRYLAEPRVWCRMAPLRESDVIVVRGRVWRMPVSARAKAGRQARARSAWAVRAGVARAGVARAGVARAGVARAGVARIRAGAKVAADRDQPVRPKTGRTPPRPVARGYAGVFDRPAVLRAGQARPAGPAVHPEPRRRPVRSSAAPPTRPAPRLATPATPATSATPATPATPAGPPVVKVVNARSAADAPPALESALAGPTARRSDGRAGRVTVVPGGHRPGKPDQLQRDRARVRLPISGPRRVVVLGCTVGAGQTVVTLLTGEVLASLRSDLVAVLDLNPGAESLARQAQRRLALGQAASLGSSRLAFLTPAGGPDPAEPEPEPVPEPEFDPAEALAAFERATATHQIVLADPSTIAVTRLLTIADQLVLVAPASAAAARATSMTFEWLDAHARASLAADAIMVMNGVSRRSVPHVEQAERVCIGRCRAIVRVPWDDQLKIQSIKRTSSTPSRSQAGQQRAGLLSPATVSACTALGGVLVAALADQDGAGRVPQ